MTYIQVRESSLNAIGTRSAKSLIRNRRRTNGYPAIRGKVHL